MSWSASDLAHVTTPALDIAYVDSGPRDGTVVLLLHGFPYDIHAFVDVVPILNAAGLRTVVPYVRGFGDTRLRDPTLPRAGEQASIGQDLYDLLDALHIERAILAGFDWGARSACIVAACWSGRVRALVTVGGYQIQDISLAGQPADPAQEHRLWYQHYFQTERGRLGLDRHRAAYCRLLWQQWSPTWAFDAATYTRTAATSDR